MPSINETKEKIGVVQSVGGFANALQQIAAMRMMALRDKVLASKRFVDEATEILRELNLYKEMVFKKEYAESDKKAFRKNKKLVVEDKTINLAIILVTSNQGLCGKYNAEIFKRMEGEILPAHPKADIFIIGNKGQEHYLTNKKYNYKFYPYDLPDNFESTDLLRLTGIFPHYHQIIMIFSRYINTIKRDVTETMLVTNPEAYLKDNKEENSESNLDVGPDGKVRYIFEPSLNELIDDISSKLRAAAFQQQILDSRLAQFSAQMVGMQAASENAKVLLKDLNQEYNKARRKMIDKKISEVFAGSTLW